MEAFCEAIENRRRCGALGTVQIGTIDGRQVELHRCSAHLVLLNAEPTARDYAQEVIDQQRREDRARLDAADWLIGAIQTTPFEGVKGVSATYSIRLKEWRLASGNQSELTVRRPDGMVLKFTITASEE